MLDGTFGTLRLNPIDGTSTQKQQEADSWRAEFYKKTVQNYHEEDHEKFESALASVLSLPEYCDAMFWLDRTLFRDGIKMLDFEKVSRDINKTKVADFLFERIFATSSQRICAQTANQEVKAACKREADKVMRYIHLLRTCAWYDMIASEDLITYEINLMQFFEYPKLKARYKTASAYAVHIIREAVFHHLFPDGDFPYKLFVFDLDHCLVKPKGGKQFRNTIDDWEWNIDVSLFQELKRRVFDLSYAVTANQGGVAYGIFKQRDMEAHIKEVADTIGAKWYACFTHPRVNGDDSRRKPNTGMLKEAMNDSGVDDPGAILVIGSRYEDQQMAKKMKASFCFANIFFTIMREKLG